ncbi:MAG: TonB-dependent receptor [Candidatus Latescibacterota bacterium]|nr:MAG: TonB-dependent receptor [Candidatus Latescibacterota bacterium]
MSVGAMSSRPPCTTRWPIPAISVSYQALFNDIEGRRDNFAYRYNPDGLAKQRTRAITHGLDVSHALGPSAFYNLSLRQNYFDYEDKLYDDVWDPRYDAAGPPITDPNYELGAVIQGADFTRFSQRTTTYLAKGSFVDQVNEFHLVKIGGEYQLPRIRFGTPGHLVASIEDGIPTLVRHVDEPPDYPGVVEYRPVIASAFAQDQIEWNEITLRAGARFDYFDARSTVPSNLANPANSIAGAPPSVPKPTSRKTSVSPRLGVAYPITDRAAIHFAYGHFYQYPPIGEIFKNSDYSILTDLQAGGADYEALGNPDIKPEQTIQYEFGYKHALTDRLGLDLTLFYKDIRDLLGVEFVSTYNVAEYSRLTNVDYGSVVGFTVSLDQRRIGILSSTLDYTWQLAQGNSSDPRETATRAEAGLDDRPRQVPFNWDQRHTLNMSIALDRPNDFAVSTIVRMASGQPYTPVLESGFGYGLESNSGRKPASLLIDMRAEKLLRRSGDFRVGLFGRAFNVLDTRYSNGFVFADTGSPYYTRFPEQTSLYDPTRFYAARRVEIGLRIGMDG